MGLNEKLRFNVGICTDVFSALSFLGIIAAVLNNSIVFQHFKKTETHYFLSF